MTKKVKRAAKSQQIERWSDEAIDAFITARAEDFALPEMKWGASEQRPYVLLRWAQDWVADLLPQSMEEGDRIYDEYPEYMFDPVGEFPALFWVMVYREWAAFDAIPHREYGELLRLMRYHRPIELMHAKVRDFYENLPDEITVYRGGDARSVLSGLSWTMDYGTAESFAYGHRGMFNQHPVILSGKVKKSDIAFATDDRGEKEVVVFDVREVKDEQVLRVLEPKQSKAAA